MACELAASAVDPDKPLRWASYSSQEQAATGMQSMSVLTTGPGEESAYIFVDRLTRKTMKDTRFCFSVNAKTACQKPEDEACLYDSDYGHVKKKIGRWSLEWGLLCKSPYFIVMGLIRYLI